MRKHLVPAVPPPQHLEAIRERLSYGPETGILTWASLPWHRMRQRIGTQAGTAHSGGWLQVSIKVGSLQILLKAHHIIWFLHFGEWPNSLMDHMNGNPTDNRICNLRLATPSGNAQNQRMHTRNKTGVRGVSIATESGRYLVQISKDGHNMRVGEFDTLEEATAARLAAERKYHGVFAASARSPPPP